ncbi:exodeoxyribonuclease V subunit beta [Catenovulum sp. SM1970]|uniref:exodeoxyribonuclease V subunit beta n=1 Tax=Marinifaba aquimaris TaxID=2741323 RepID=UPI00157306D9|nr:exodeoxyribonuclease V subunit beta [Marinifaba aquimaris]NTS78561.1 exodeoxyribonuclease V subunit beta [Marinifaba aquimaris]
MEEQKNMQQLDAAEIPLNGSHIIEASAGTGKTYNITRIYLRLLLEKKLNVQQILVVTFTQAATQELKGRINKELRAAISKWHQPTDELDTFFKSLVNSIDFDEAKTRLDHAILHMDEAAIFTIHGFCSSVLAEHSLLAKVNFNLKLTTDTQAIVMQSIEDMYRRLALNEQSYKTLASKHPSPQHFYAKYHGLITSQTSIEHQSLASIEQTLSELQARALASINDGAAVIESVLVDGDKTRLAQYEAMHLWLSYPLEQLTTLPIEQDIKKFIDGRRFSRKPADIKVQLKAALAPLNELIKAITTYPAACDDVKANELIKSLIDKIRCQVSTHKNTLNLVDFNDLITLVSEAVADENKRDLTLALADQYPAILVDEFQDTDEQQYRIFSTIHQSVDKHLFLMIGDPKQAIYRFRGGDIHTYLLARSQAQYQWVMDTNYRSSEQVVNAYNRVFLGEAINETSEQIQTSFNVFGQSIAYQAVKAHHKDSLFVVDDAERSAMNLIYFGEVEPGKVNPASYRQHIADIFALEISRLLSDRNPIKLSSEGQLSKLGVKDIAILVRDKTEAVDMQQALTKQGLNSVYLSNRDNIYTTEHAQALYRFLQGVWHLDNQALFITALASPFIGLDENALMRLNQDEYFWETWRDKILDLKQIWQKQSLISMCFEALFKHSVLNQTNIERDLTNYLHLIELLQKQAQKFSSIPQLIDWFEQQINQPEYISESELRLESEKDLIQITTFHGSKGLEYPIVFIPFATRYKESRRLDYMQYFDADTGNNKVFLGNAEHIYQKYLNETHQEDVRLLYVAITRAIHRCYLGVTPFANNELSPFGLCLSKPDDLKQALQLLCADNSNLSVIDSDAVNGEEKIDNIEQAKVDLQAKQFTHQIEKHWRMHSFSAMTKDKHHISVLEHKELDEDEQGNVNKIESNLINFLYPKGAKPGLVLHEALEDMDFITPEWTQLTDKVLSIYGDKDDAGDISAVTEWFNAIIQAPLNSSQFCLAQLAYEKTLREVTFYFPTQLGSTKQINQILSQCRGASGNDYIEHVSSQKLEGMFNGVIDLVFEFEGKYYVADYKSNFLGECFSDYNSENMKLSMESSFYDLQSLIYSLALHQYLKQRIEDYDINEHLGGSYYLFLRGMSNQSEHQGAGIYFTPNQPQAILALESAFNGVDA